MFIRGSQSWRPRLPVSHSLNQNQLQSQVTCTSLWILMLVFQFYFKPVFGIPIAYGPLAEEDGSESEEPLMIAGNQELIYPSPEGYYVHDEANAAAPAIVDTGFEFLVDNVPDGDDGKEQQLQEITEDQRPLSLMKELLTEENTDPDNLDDDTDNDNNLVDLGADGDNDVIRSNIGLPPAEEETGEAEDIPLHFDLPGQQVGRRKRGDLTPVDVDLDDIAAAGSYFPTSFSPPEQLTREPTTDEAGAGSRWSSRPPLVRQNAFDFSQNDPTVFYPADNDEDDEDADDDDDDDADLVQLKQTLDHMLQKQRAKKQLRKLRETLTIVRENLPQEYADTDNAELRRYRRSSWEEAVPEQTSFDTNSYDLADGQSELPYSQYIPSGQETIPSLGLEDDDDDFTYAMAPVRTEEFLIEEPAFSNENPTPPFLDESDATISSPSLSSPEEGLDDDDLYTEDNPRNYDPVKDLDYEENQLGEDDIRLSKRDIPFSENQPSDFHMEAITDDSENIPFIDFNDQINIPMPNANSLDAKLSACDMLRLKGQPGFTGRLLRAEQCVIACERREGTRIFSHLLNLLNWPCGEGLMGQCNEKGLCLSITS